MGASKCIWGSPSKSRQESDVRGSQEMGGGVHVILSG